MCHLAIVVLDSDLMPEEPCRCGRGVDDQGLRLRQLQLQLVAQETGDLLFDLLSLGFGSDEPEQMIVGVTHIPQPAVALIHRIAGPESVDSAKRGLGGRPVSPCCHAL